MLAKWDRDLPAAWRQILAGTQLNWRSPALDHELLPGEMILPGRKGKPLAAAPKGAHLLRAFEGTNPDGVRAVILGQDPYHDIGQAHGLSFSVLPGVKLPGSLRNIFKELKDDVSASAPKHGCLISWAREAPNCPTVITRLM